MAHHLRLNGNRFYNTGEAGAGTAVRLTSSSVTDNISIADNAFEYCRQVLSAFTGRLSCSKFSRNYIEYHTTEPLGFSGGGGLASSYGLEINYSWFAIGPALRLYQVANGELKWNTFREVNISGVGANVEGSVAKNRLVGTSAWLP